MIHYISRMVNAVVSLLKRKFGGQTMSSSFNAKSEILDPIETEVRDNLGVNLHHWILFRRAINCGTSAEPPVLTFNPGFDTVERRDAFLDLGKSNYEVACCLGFARQTLIEIQRLQVTTAIEQLRFFRVSKEFYFHAGSVLDNLARLIFIINDPNSHSSLAPRSTTTFRRRWVAWGDFERDIRAQHTDYLRFVNDSGMQEFRNIRHFLTHVWAPVKQIRGGIIEWPEEITTSRVFAWPHDPRDQAEMAALNFVPVIPMIERHWNELERFQNAVYQQLTLDVTAKFEPNFGCKIMPIS